MSFSIKPTIGNIARGVLSKRPNLWNGLVGCWNPSLGFSGNKLIDVSDNKNHGTFTNMDMADWGTSNNAKTPGYSIDFDGVDDCIKIPSSSKYDSSVGTWSVWVNIRNIPSSASGTHDPVLSRHDSSGSFNGIGLRITDSLNVRAAIKDSSSNIFNISGPITLELNNWYHIVVTWMQSNGGSVKVYINSVLDVAGNTTNSWNFNNQELWIGDSPGSFWDEFDGFIGNTHIYNRILSVPEIRDLYQNPNAMFEYNNSRLGFVPTVATGRIMSSLVNYGGLAGHGGLAGIGGGLAN